MAEVEAVAVKAARLDAFVAVPLAQRYTPFATRARELLAVGRFGPLSHIYVQRRRELAGHAGHVRQGAGRAHAPSQRGRRNPCHARGDWEHAGAALRPLP